MKKLPAFKLFLLIILIIGIVFVIGKILAKTKNNIIKTNNKLTQTVPPDWKQYQSNKQQFSFSYPADWKLEILQDTDAFLSLSLIKEDNSQEKVEVYKEMLVPYYSINITVNVNKKDMSARDYYFEQFVTSAQETAQEKFTDVSVGGVEGIEYLEGAAPSSGPATAVLVTNNQKAYNFIYSALAHGQTHEKFLDIFKTILRSVEFTGSSNPRD